MAEATLVTFIAALFSMMNPIGNMGIFSGMTADRPTGEIRKIAAQCALACALTLLIIIWSGSGLLKFFGISVDQLRAGGGIIVLIIGLHMLFNKSEHKTSAAERDDRQDSIAVVPLAIPLVAGPGTMATALVASQHHPDIVDKVDFSVAVVALCALTGLLFAYSKIISGWLGKSGMAVVTRIMGMLLVAIATGMIIDGVVAMIPALAGQFSGFLIIWDAVWIVMRVAIRAGNGPAVLKNTWTR